MKFELDLDGGKYTYRFDNGKQDALRHGEPWRDLCGDNLVYWLAVEVRSYREACGDLVIPGDAPPGVLADLLTVARDALPLLEDEYVRSQDRLQEAIDTGRRRDAVEARKRLMESFRLQAEFARSTLAKLGVVPALEANPEPVSPR